MSILNQGVGVRIVNPVLFVGEYSGKGSYIGIGSCGTWSNEFRCFCKKYTRRVRRVDGVLKEKDREIEEALAGTTTSL